MSDEDMEIPDELAHYGVTCAGWPEPFVVLTESYHRAALAFAEHYLQFLDGIQISEVRQQGMLVTVRRMSVGVRTRLCETEPSGLVKEFIIAKIKSPYVAIDPSAPSDTENA